MTDRPRILITRAEDVLGERWDDYADRVEAAGGEAAPVDLSDWDASAPPEYDGLLVTAGADVDPARYGEPPHQFLGPTNAERDAFEAALIADALERDVPVLSICRGHQLFNVVHGGSLLQHIEEREPHRARRGEDGVSIASGWHDVAITPGTILAGILGEGPVRVNSRHHQAVTPERVAPNLVVAGQTEDGVIEALEDPSKRWAVSVQWHPERDEMGDAPRALFEAFVAACRDSAAEAR
jgi:gamma-glutamyl-gamma-aminobutyrate hydrolase PuuD